MRPKVLLLTLLAAASAFFLPLIAQDAGDEGSEDAPWSQEDLERVSKRIRGDIETLRGQTFQREVKVAFADAETFLDYALAQNDKHTTTERVEGGETVARMLGLIPPDMDLMETTLDFLRDQVGGFYAPGDDTFWLMENFHGKLAEVILAHELTHALDDQLYDIDGELDRLELNTDAMYAYSAVVEGSGTGLMNRWMMEKVQLGEIALSDVADMDQLGAAADSMAEAPAFIWKPLLVVYLRGASFLARSDDVMKGQMTPHDLHDIDRAFRVPPSSMEQILHPEKYWDEGTRDDPLALAFDVDGIPEGWDLLYEDTLGELLIAMLTSGSEDRGGLDMTNPAAMLAVAYTNEVAEGWGGDRLVLLGKGSGRLLRWVTRWDGATDAAEFFGALHVQMKALDASLEQIAEIDVGGNKARYHDTDLAYGESPDEVVVTLSFGVKRSDARKLLGALRHGTPEDLGTDGHEAADE